MELSLDKVSQRALKFNWKDELQSTPVKIHIPDLTNLSVKKWADWGPMYHFALNSNDPVQFSISGETRSLDQNVLRIESPAAAKERKKYPFCIFVEDDMTESKFKIFLTEDYEIGKVEVKRRRERINIYQNSSEKEAFSEAM